MTLFVNGPFTSHSGLSFPFKIECDSLTQDEIDVLAKMAYDRFGPFRDVISVPTGGDRFAAAIKKLIDADEFASRVPIIPVVIVDDVLATGASMEEALEKAVKDGIKEEDCMGIVIFSRCATKRRYYLQWIEALFEDCGS